MASPAGSVPTGTLTFLFTDIEGSTPLLERVGVERYRALLEEHQRILRDAFAAHGGAERSTEGDSFFVVFTDAPSAIAAAVAAQRALPDHAPAEAVRVRMGIHTGQGVAGGDDVVGLDVHRAARIAASAHGGQIVISDATRALGERNLPNGVGILDLGAHRLRGITAPEHLYQLVVSDLPSAFPPPRTERLSRAHLPARLTSFVGREDDLVALEGALAANRLVTLVGPGGAGKTSLAIERARLSAEDFPDGAWFVELEAIADADLVPDAIAAALGLRDPTNRPAREVLPEHLSTRNLLLVLDNLEQVLTASGLIAALLGAAPDLRVIATSRAPLRVAGEQVYPVMPLVVPPRPANGVDAGAAQMDGATLEIVADAPAVRLFIDRAQRVQPTFVLTAENARAVIDICTRLDGLPLGIELAAARVPLLGVGGIAERLERHVALPPTPIRDAPARQRTLREAIAWSHELLEPPARRLLARLAVFSGGWQLDEAEAVCGPAEELGDDVLTGLAELVDQSLVTSRAFESNARYDLLETIHEFATDQLEAGGEAEELRRRHARTYLNVAEKHAPAVRSRDRRSALERLRAERDNLRGAVRWAIEHKQAEIALRLATALVELRGAPPWGVGGGLEESRSDIRSALELPGADAPSVIRMRALEAAGTVSYYLGDLGDATARYLQQLELGEQLGDAQGAADARFNLVWTDEQGFRAEGLDERLDRIDADYQAVGDERGRSYVAFVRGQRLLQLGRPQDAVGVLEDAMRGYEKRGDVAYMSMTAGTLGSAHLMVGDREAAIHWFIDVVRLAADLGDEVVMTINMPIGAVAAIERGRPEAAAMILGAHEALARRYGVRPPLALERVYEQYGARSRARAEMDPLAFEAALARGRQLSIEEATALVLEMDTAQESLGQPGG